MRFETPSYRALGAMNTHTTSSVSRECRGPRNEESQVGRRGQWYGGRDSNGGDVCEEVVDEDGSDRLSRSALSRESPNSPSLCLV
ncbi:uncharacterized protein J3R85_001615 [Psidium guajava]|nr:uncharacterized protein J3R85_001615 [Psidium guajava]